MNQKELDQAVNLAHDIGELKGRYKQAKSEIKRLTMMLEEYVKLDRAGLVGQWPTSPGDRER